MLKLYKNFDPLVSVILPTFNRENLILRAVHSVVIQSFESWELLVVDDGSSDSTYSVLADIIGSYANVRYMNHSNRKLPISLNVGIQASTGSYITFLGSDDQYKSSHLEERFNFMKSNPQIDLIHGGVEIIGDPYVKDKDDLSKRIHLVECTIGGTFFGKRQVFFEMNGFNDIEYSEDSDFIERASKKFSITKVSFPTYIYHRDTPGSICNTI